MAVFLVVLAVVLSVLHHQAIQGLIHLLGSGQSSHLLIVCDKQTEGSQGQSFIITRFFHLLL